MGRADNQSPNEELPGIGGVPGSPQIPAPSPNLRENLLNRLDELGLLDDPKFTAEVLGAFLRDGLRTMEELETAIREGEKAACELLAHRMKGASLNLGAERLGSIALAIERFACDGDLSRTIPLIAPLWEEFESVRACLLRLPGMPKAA